MDRCTQSRSTTTYHAIAYSNHNEDLGKLAAYAQNDPHEIDPAGGGRSQITLLLMDISSSGLRAVDYPSYDFVGIPKWES
jgi:hypothetical protein